MARGNTTGKNTLLSDSNITATESELAAFSRYAMDIFKKDPPNLHDADAVNAAVVDYFKACEENGIRPSNLGLYAALGMSRQDVNNVLTGKSKTKASPDVIDIIKKCKLSLSAYREALVMAGKVNPVTAIFWAKNYDQMTDTQQIEITTERGDAPLLTQSDIEKRIPVYSDVDIDMDSSE